MRPHGKPVSEWEFAPHRVNGEAVASTLPVRVTFSLMDE